MTLTLDSILTRTGDLLDSSIDDETVLLSIKSSKYYGMDPVASRIWSLLHQPIQVSAILSTLLEEYDVSEEECAKDVLDFLTHLMEEGLIRHSDE